MWREPGEPGLGGVNLLSSGRKDILGEACLATLRIVIEVEAPDTVIERITAVLEKLIQQAQPEKAPAVLSLEVSDVSGRITLRATPQQ